MNLQTVLEYLRSILIAFCIAFVLYLFFILIFGIENPFTNITEWRTTLDENAQYNIPDEQNKQNNHIQENIPEITQNFDQDELDERGRIRIPITPRVNLGGKSKNEILELRRQAVNSSPIFNNMKYEPNPNVFNISDYKPWISANGALYWSKATDTEKVNGDSVHSIGVLNPELLYYVSLAEYKDTDGTWIPFYKPSFFVPYKVLYRPDTKTIIAYIKGDKNENGNYEPIHLTDVNAHDLGYNYAYMNMHKNIGFYREYENNTLTSEVKPVTGYYMHGPACGVAGGCNNYAPYWQYYNNFYIEKLPAKLNIKLWKQKPANPEDEADINFKMFFY